MLTKRILGMAAAVGLLSTGQAAHAALTLTAAGVADGFTLSTFYSDPLANYGALGATTMANGKVIVAGYGHQQIMTFNDVDGQTYGSALNKATANLALPYEVATVGGKTYFTYGGAGTYYQVDPTTLALTPVTLNTPVTPYLGLWGNQVTGHLVSDSSLGLVDIDPVTGNVHQIFPGGLDGVSVSPDGTVAYQAGSALIRGFNILTSAQVLNVVSPHGPDGTGVISGGSFNGFIIVNNNDGTVGLINPHTSIETTIASGGLRGDFVGPDLTNGTLFLATTDRMYRLALQGGSIGGGPTPNGGVPEPGVWAMLLTGFASLGGMLRRRRRLEAAAA
jgi:hypothetical protein